MLCAHDEPVLRRYARCADTLVKLLRCWDKPQAGNLLLVVEDYPRVDRLLFKVASDEHGIEALDLLRAVASLFLEGADLGYQSLPRLGQLVGGQRLLHGIVVVLDGLLEFSLFQAFDELLGGLLEIGELGILVLANRDAGKTRKDD